MHFCCDNSNKRHLLFNVKTLSNQVASQSPHIVPAKVLILEHELHEVRTVFVLVHLDQDKFTIDACPQRSKTRQHTFVRVTSLLLFRPNVSKTAFGSDIFPIPHISLPPTTCPARSIYVNDALT